MVENPWLRCGKKRRVLYPAPFSFSLSPFPQPVENVENPLLLPYFEARVSKGFVFLGQETRVSNAKWYVQLLPFEAEAAQTVEIPGKPLAFPWVFQGPFWYAARS